MSGKMILIFHFTDRLLLDRIQIVIIGCHVAQRMVYEKNSWKRWIWSLQDRWRNGFCLLLLKKRPRPKTRIKGTKMENLSILLIQMVEVRVGELQYPRPIMPHLKND